MDGPLQVPPDGPFKLNLRMRHLEQLRQVDIPEGGFPSPPSPWPWPLPPNAPSPYDQLVQWSKQARSQIQFAIASR